MREALVAWDVVEVVRTHAEDWYKINSKRCHSSAQPQPEAEALEFAMADSFQLYDLRVDVVCPVGERILCGAKDGHYFTLQGEMLYLPPEQGFSIYSLGKSPFRLLVCGVWVSRNNRISIVRRRVAFASGKAAAVACA